MSVPSEDPGTSGVPVSRAATEPAVERKPIWHHLYFWVLVAIVAGVVFLPLYFRGYWCRGRSEKLWIIGALTAMGMLLSPVNAGALAPFSAAGHGGINYFHWKKFLTWPTEGGYLDGLA